MPHFLQPVFFTTLLLLLPFFCPAQPGMQVPADTGYVRYMVLDKGWPVHRVRFYPGDRLMFKLKGERGWNYGRIQWVNKNSLHILDSTIPFSEIRKISIRRNGYRNNFANLSANSFVGGGVTLMLAGTINAIGNKNGEKATIAYAGAGAIVLGLAVKALNQRTFKISGNRRLKSI